MQNDYVLAVNDDGDLAVRTVSATESSAVTDTMNVITRTEDGKLAVRVVGGGDSHNKGYFATQAALEEAYPTGAAGDYAIVGSTDTVWIWDEDNSAWTDSDQKGQVTSVNNQTGAVTITADDILPTQTGYSGRVLGTDGFVAGWIVPEQVQRSTMPQAGEDELGNIYQFTGTTDANYTNGYFYKCVSDGGNPATYSWSQVSVQPAPSGLPSQTGQSGKFLTTDGTDASWATISALQNTATGTNSLTVGGTAASANYATNVGDGSSSAINSVAVGRNASASGNSIAIGNGCTAGSTAVVVGRGANGGASSYVTLIGPYVATTSTIIGGVAIGSSAKIGANNAIQINAGTSAATNSDANTFKVANANGNFELMNANGNLPADRLASTTGLADGNYRLRLVMASGVPTLEWVAE